MISWPQVNHPLPKPRPVLSGLFLCIFCLIPGFPSISLALDRTISLSNGCALPGESAQIEICLSEAEGMAGCDLSIAFDPNVFTILDVNTTLLTQDFLLSHGTPTPGLLHISMACGEGLLALGPGAIAIVKLKMASSSAAGTRTALLIREAHWYTELSARQNLLGDNAVFEAGTETPAEDGGIVFAMDSCHGQPGNLITTGLWISLPVGVARMEGNLTYDAKTLLSPLLIAAPSLTGWSQEVQYNSGQIHFIFSGTTELSGPDPIQIASCNWTLSPDAEPGSQSDIAVSDPQATNQDDFGFLCLGRANTVLVATPEPLLVNHWEEY